MKIFEKEWFDGIRVVYKFDNGYGASIIRHSFSFGGREGLYEIGVLSFNFSGFELIFRTPICYDVIGHLYWEEVESILKNIEALPESETRKKEKEILFRKF